VANQKAPWAQTADAALMRWCWPETDTTGVCPFGSPRHAVHRIGAQARLVTEIDLALVPPDGACDRGVGLALVGALQGFLRGQTLSSQQRADRGQAHAHTESLADQFSYAVPRPHPEIESVLPGGACR
jgi:hypothetical protein